MQFCKCKIKGAVSVWWYESESERLTSSQMSLFECFSNEIEKAHLEWWFSISFAFDLVYSREREREILNENKEKTNTENNLSLVHRSR